MSFEEFQDDPRGSHLGYRNGRILAILSLCVTVMLQSNLRFRRCRLKNFKMAAWRPSSISQRNDFSNSESLCRSDAFHQVSAHSNLGGDVVS